MLLEVGLGGRLDSTNVVDTPAACVITPISMDHMDFLGDTLTSIAGEKAAIIKRGVPVICAEQTGEAMAVIEAQARHMRAPLFAAGESWHVNVEHGRLVYSDDRGLMDLAAPRLFGRHQFDNAGLAIATLRAIPAFKVNQAAFEAGIVGAEWPARGCSASPRASCSRSDRRARRSGSTAATMPKAGASRRPRSAISKSGCRVRWS
ncbi:folylpolyglutamate synthase/dihydrofolate synthase [Bradyrhizobium sp. i1.4.4]